MMALLVFAVTLLVAILLSELAGRSVLSTAVLFLVAGFAAGADMLNLIPVNPHEKVVSRLAELALCSVLFTDGMRASIGDITKAWRLPGRALLLGLPLTLLITAALAYVFAGLSWAIAFLVGAILCPTDPVFAAAIVGREEVSARLRFLLNVESGINDGLALPIVLALLGIVGHQDASFLQLGMELLWGIAIGVLLPLLICRLEGSRFFGVAKPYEPLFAFAVGLLVLAVAAATHGNIYLAAFAAGITIVSTRPDLRDEFHEFGELLAELFKLAAILIFGATISFSYFSDINLGGYIFALLALVFARPAALLISLWRSPLDWRERLTAAWFGPKGFASVIYGLLLFQAGVPEADHIFHLIAIVIAGSMIAHSSTDVLVARWFAGTASAPDKNGIA
jgi:NhaP-type Na+/H+ or K+/H+ antiporter